MAPKLKPNQLREQAQKLLDQAAEEEVRRHQLIGKKIVELIENDFQGFNLDAFKDETRQIWSEGKVKRKAKPIKPKPIQTTA